jgi:hypothetical protein
MSPRENGHQAATTMLRGFMCVGALIDFGFADPVPGETRQPLGNVRVECIKPDGEPYWARFWFRADQQALLAALRALSLGDLVALGFRNLENRSGRTSQQAEWVQPWTPVPALEAVAS